MERGRRRTRWWVQFWILVATSAGGDSGRWLTVVVAECCPEFGIIVWCVFWIQFHPTCLLTWKLMDTPCAQIHCHIWWAYCIGPKFVFISIIPDYLLHPLCLAAFLFGLWHPSPYTPLLRNTLFPTMHPHLSPLYYLFFCSFLLFMCLVLIVLN